MSGRKGEQMPVIVDLRGPILTPLAGTVRWVTGPDGRCVAAGTWGRDHPCLPHVEVAGGGVRQLTRAERRWLARMERRGRR